MEKEFFDVFPNLKLKQELSELLEEVIVTKVACNAAKTCVRVYLRSDRWIHKKHIFSLEEQIKRQCFPGLEVSVKVIEKFHLSRQYTPKNFLDTYRSSMELELRNYNMLEYNLFKQAQITFPEEDCLHMVLPDSVIARQKSEILIEYLHKIFCERCGMDLKVSLDYVETEESKYRRNAAIQIQQEVANVLKHAKLSEANKAAEAETAKEEKEGKNWAFAASRRWGIWARALSAWTKRPPSRPGPSWKRAQEKKSFEKKPFEKKGKWGDFRGGYRKDPNPDVIYGRDFEGEPIPLESIVQEMGEVIVRCQVMEVEAREIRNEKTILIFPVTDFTDSITVKMFLRNEQVPEVTEHVKKGAFLKIKGVTSIDRFDSELTIGSISGIKKIADFRSASRIAVMHDGVLEQLDVPMEIYEHPKTKFVAGFIGESNIFDGKVTDKKDNVLTVQTEAGMMQVATVPDSGICLRVHQRITTVFRWTAQGPRCCHLHLSNPYSEMDASDSGFPEKMAEESRRYLRESSEKYS